MGWEGVTIILGSVLAVSGVAGVFFANYRNKLIRTQEKNYKQTINSYKGLVTTQNEKIDFLNGEVKELRDAHTESIKLIGQLQGELKSWKELPIRELAQHMSYVSEVQYIMAKHMGIDHLPDIPIKNAGTSKRGGAK